MAGYPAPIDGEHGACSVTFPDLPGIVAMGASVDEALVNAEEALRDQVIEAEEPATPSRRRPRWNGQAVRRLPVLDSADGLENLAGLPSNRPEALRGDRAGQHSNRINAQWRI